MNIVGILLAAGSGSRFGGGKLLHRLADGTPIGVAAARNLETALQETLVVVRPGDERLAELLAAEGMRITVCDRAHLGMGTSLAWGVAQSPEAMGWIVALADMPYIRPDTIRAVAHALQHGASLAAPVYRGQRGHPVGFARTYGSALMRLEGDAGARDIVAAHERELVLLECDDPGTLQDIDRPADVLDRT